MTEAENTDLLCSWILTVTEQQEHHAQINYSN